MRGKQRWIIIAWLFCTVSGCSQPFSALPDAVSQAQAETVTLEPGWQYIKKPDGVRFFKGTVVNHSAVDRTIQVWFNIHDKKTQIGSWSFTAMPLKAHQTRHFVEKVGFLVTDYNDTASFQYVDDPMSRMSK